MAIADMIAFGVGPGASVPDVILMGLSAGDAPEPEDPRTLVLATTGMSAMSGCSDDMELG
jgi:hypothetical protein